MLKGGSGAAGGGHRISAGRHKRRSTKSGAALAQVRARLLRIGAAVGFGVRQAPVPLIHDDQARLELVPAPCALPCNGARRLYVVRGGGR